MLSRQEGNVLPQLPDERSIGSAVVIQRPPVAVTHSYVGTMVELAFYPAVALIYFFGVLQAHKDGRVNLPDSASVNVFCLFVLIQPLCLIIGGYTGMATYLISAYVSYNVLPWKKPCAAQQEDAEKKKKKKTKTN